MSDSGTWLPLRARITVQMTHSVRSRLHAAGVVRPATLTANAAKASAQSLLRAGAPASALKSSSMAHRLPAAPGQSGAVAPPEGRHRDAIQAVHAPAMQPARSQPPVTTAAAPAASHQYGMPRLPSDPPTCQQRCSAGPSFELAVTDWLGCSCRRLPAANGAAPESAGSAPVQHGQHPPGLCAQHHSPGGGRCTLCPGASHCRPLRAQQHAGCLCCSAGVSISAHHWLCLLWSSMGMLLGALQAPLSQPLLMGNSAAPGGPLAQSRNCAGAGNLMCCSTVYIMEPISAPCQGKQWHSDELARPFSLWQAVMVNQLLRCAGPCIVGQIHVVLPQQPATSCGFRPRPPFTCWSCTGTAEPLQQKQLAEKSASFTSRKACPQVQAACWTPANFAYDHLVDAVIRSLFHCSIVQKAFVPGKQVLQLDMLQMSALAETP